MTQNHFGTDVVKAPLCVLAMSLLMIGGCAEEAPPPPPKPVKAVQISDPGGLSEGTFPGLAAAAQEANMSFRVAGPLIEMPVTVGDTVEAGALVARIDPNDYEVALRNAEAILAAAQATAQRAEADYDRLFGAQQEDPGATSQRAVDLALSARDAARAGVSSAQATAQTARDALSYTSLVAPFDGEVVETYVENFETIVPMQPILRLVNNNSIEMTLSIPENLIGYADFVTGITITFDALPGVEIPATITEIGGEASQATRTYPLTVAMGQPDGAEILPGMAGRAHITAELPDTVETGLHVPPTALFAGTDTEHSYVWVIENDTVTRREVQIGNLTSNGILITDGLSAGELIVAAGVSSLVEGQSVQIIDVGESQ